MSRLLLLVSLGFLLAAPLQAMQDFRVRVSQETISIQDLEEDVKAELTFGRELAARILGMNPLHRNQALRRYLNLIGTAVAMHGSRSEIDFQFGVLDTDAINAYAAPGGYIFVTRGALELMQDEAELAAVLAHEVAHVTEKHIVKAVKLQGRDTDAGSLGLAHLLGGASDPARIAFAQAIDQAVDLLFRSGLDKEDEYDADRVGTLILASTGYDPTALHRYLDRVRLLKGDAAAILSHTHPPFTERLTRIDNLLTSENLSADQGVTLAERFGHHTQGVRKP